MSILHKIIPFYGAVEELIKVGGDVVREDQKRRTLRTEAEIKVYLATEASRRQAEVDAWRERQAAETQVFKETEVERRSNELQLRAEGERRAGQIAFEQHRVELFERVKRLEIEIHQELDEYEISKRKEIAEWGRSFIRRLEDETEGVMTDRLPRMIAQAQVFRDQPEVYQEYIKRVFTAADQITTSVNNDLTEFRIALADLQKRPEQLNAALTELNRRLTFGSAKQLGGASESDEESP